MKFIKYFVLVIIWGYLIFWVDRYTRFHHFDPISTPIITKRAESILPLASPELALFGPSPEILDTLVSRIAGANVRVYLSVYMLTEMSIVQALIAAEGRNVDVRVLLEPSVYNLPAVNKKATDLLRKADIKVSFSSERGFNFNHSKYLIVDNTAMIATGNMTKSSLHINRELFVWYTAPRVVEELEKLFIADFDYIPVKSSNDTIILAPLNARSSIEWLIRSSKRSITLMSESFSDSRLVDLLIEATSRWVNVEVCTPQNRPLSIQIVSTLKSAWVTFLIGRGPQIHAKTVLIDNTRLLFGSTNFTENSLDNNREVSMIIDTPEIILRYKKIIASDCKRE